ncbi:MAG: hypothetical protein HOO67_00940 [Candidatus Peribacteraceae bacterium]|nr:hypothetical protein [Candidatus Peribacteraceae bacterium]
MALHVQETGYESAVPPTPQPGNFLQACAECGHALRMWKETMEDADHSVAFTLRSYEVELWLFAVRNLHKSDTLRQYFATLGSMELLVNEHCGPEYALQFRRKILLILDPPFPFHNDEQHEAPATVLYELLAEERAAA